MGTTHFVASTGNDFPTESLKDWVARVPRKVVLHRMETAECLEDRVFWAIILWSWCGPQVSDAVVIKDRRGYIQKDAAGKPVPAKLGDLLSLLGLAPGMKGHISRAIQRLTAKDSVRYEGRVLYPVKEPNPPENLPIVASTGNVFIAGIVINIDEIVASTGNGEVARPELVQLLNDLSTEWKTGLKQLKTDIKALLVQRLSAHGILISEKKRRRDNEDPPSDGRAEKGSPIVEDPPENPPARPLDGSPDKDSPLRRELRTYLAGKPVTTKLDGPMFERIARWITTDEIFDGFRKAADEVKNPRKWAIFETIAEQVAARGTIPKPLPVEESYWERKARELSEERKRENASG